ncbi:DUF1540 domain-containing protein [Microtetraspora fusca]|uniref:DUF1540 domain-containing protein n=1 Tax=Microtetraspora fusca TaxID=1997 RepID=A0ABW6UZ70_MICFU
MGRPLPGVEAVILERGPDGQANQHAHCDTFFSVPSKGGDPSVTGRVGACKMSDCRHNVQLECQASGIVVGYAQDAADCLTYAPA